jgi:hypothetical protein
VQLLVPEKIPHFLKVAILHGRECEMHLVPEHPERIAESEDPGTIAHAGRMSGYQRYDEYLEFHIDGASMNPWRRGRRDRMPPPYQIN